MRMSMARKRRVKPKGNSTLLDKHLAAAIESTGVAETVRHSVSGNSVKVLHRVSQKRIWLGILEFVLSRAKGWSAHVCQQYFIHKGRLLYGWNFILQPVGDGTLETAVEAVAGLLVQATKVVPRVMATGPIDTFPLVGSSRRRTARIAFDPRLPGPDKGGPSHKGAYPIKGE
jgi:hypothetical protein